MKFQRANLATRVVVVLLYGCFAGEIAAHEVALKPVERREVKIPIHDFTLTDQGAREFRFAKLRGKVTVVAFAYTTCPDVCPLITSALGQVHKGLTEAERKQAFLLTITTDPEIDTAQILAGYAKRYGADITNWSFLTGDPASLAKVWKNFGVGVNRKARGLVDHTPLTAVVDREGVLRFAHIGAAPDAKSLLTDIRALLKR
jgi:protein SCO1